MTNSSTFVKLNCSKIPHYPGVYLFKNEQNKILYIGKAKNLSSRVKTYFRKTNHSLKTKNLISQVHSVDWIVVNNEVEALILENKLVKHHLPKYNINLKDSKTFAYITFTREKFPRIFTSRKTSPKWESFGPYTDGYRRQHLQKLITKVFKLRVCKTFPNRPCLNFHIGLCLAPCTGEISQKQYQLQVDRARTLLNGKYQEIIDQLTSEMHVASINQKYEHALELRNQLGSIHLLTQRQIVDKVKGFDQDVLAFRRFREKELVVQMSLRKGVLLGKKEFSIEYQIFIEQEFLKSFYSVNQIPREILLNNACWENSEGKRTLEEYFSIIRGASVTLTLPVEFDQHALITLAEKNLELSLNKDNALVDLQISLNLQFLPHIIECFDVSNLRNDSIVSGMVQFKDAKPNKSEYRKFKIRTVTGQDDLASLKEVITRRYTRLIKEDARFPDLIVIDGGPAQVGAAKMVLTSLGLQLPLIGLAKRLEEIYLPNESIPRLFDKTSRMMLLLRAIRDAAHSFSLGYHRKRRRIKMRNDFKGGRKPS